MNRIYKTVWNRAKSLWVCVSEKVCSRAQGNRSRVKNARPLSKANHLGTLSAVTLATLLAFGFSGPASAEYYRYDQASQQSSDIYKYYNDGRYLFSSAANLNGGYLILPWHRNQGAVVYCASAFCSAKGQHWVAASIRNGSSTVDPGVVVGSQDTYAQPATLSLIDSFVEGDVVLRSRSKLLLGATLKLVDTFSPSVGDDYEVQPSQNKIIGNIVFDSNSNVFLGQTLGALYRNASDPVLTTQYPRTRFSGSSGTLTLLKPADTNDLIFDLDALHTFSSTGVNEAIRELDVKTSVKIVNTLDRSTNASSGTDLQVVVNSSGVTPTIVDIQSHQGNGFSVSGSGIVKFDGGETLRAGVAQDLSGYRNRIDLSTLTFYLDRNAVILGQVENLGLPRVGGEPVNDGPGGGLFLSSSVAVEDPTVLWDTAHANDLPYWTRVIDLSHTYVATLNDVEPTLTATELANVGGLYVRHGTVKIDGSTAPISTPIAVGDDGVLDIAANSTLTSMLQVTSGTVKFHAGQTTLPALNTSLMPTVTLSFDAGAHLNVTEEESLQWTAVPNIVTATTDVDELAELLRLHPLSLRTTSAITRLPATLNSVPTLSPPTTWVVGADSSVSDYPVIVKVEPSVTLDLRGTNTEGMVDLENLGTTNLRGINNVQFSYRGTDGGHLNISDSTLVLPSGAIWRFSTLNDLTLSNVHFTDVSEPEEPVSLSFSVANLGSTLPSWWSTEFLGASNARISTLDVDVLEDGFSLGNVALDMLTVRKATLSSFSGLPASQAVIFNDLTLTQSAALSQNVAVSIKKLTLAPNVELDVTEAPLFVIDGASIYFSDGAKFKIDPSWSNEGLGVPPLMTGPGNPSMTVSVADLNHLSTALGDVVHNEFKLSVETRNAMENVDTTALEGVQRWILGGNVTGIAGGELTVPTQVNAGATLKQASGQLHVQSLLDIQGSVDVQDLVVGLSDPMTPENSPSAQVIVHDGAVLSIRGKLTVNETSMTSIDLLDGGVLKTDVANLVRVSKQTNSLTGAHYLEPSINHPAETNVNTQRAKRGTWIPSYSDKTEEISGQTYHVYDIYELTRILDSEGYETVSNGLGVGDQITQYGLGSIELTEPNSKLYLGPIKTNLLIGENNIVTNVQNPAGYAILRLNGERTEVLDGGRIEVREALEVSTGYGQRGRLVLHQGSEITFTNGKTANDVTLGDHFVLETDVSVLNHENGNTPAWWSTITTALQRREAYDYGRMLVTTGTTQDIDPEGFQRWEVRGDGENHTAHLARDTFVPYEKSLTLDLTRIDGEDASITNDGTLRFDDITLINAADHSPIYGAGQVEKVGAALATIDGMMKYAGHTTVREGTLKLRQASGLKGNVTVKRGATLYASTEERESSGSEVTLVARRLARAVPTPHMATSSNVNSIELDRGSTYMIDLNAERYSTQAVTGDVSIGDFVKFVVNVPSDLVLEPGSTLEHVLTWAGSLSGRFASASDTINDLVFEENPNFDLQAIYDAERKSLDLKVVANSEHRDLIVPSDPDPVDPDRPDDPGHTTDSRLGEQPLLSGTGKRALADFSNVVLRRFSDRSLVCGDDTHGMWASLLGGRGRLAGTDAALGYSAEHEGVAAGAELCTGRSRAGVMLAAGHTEADDHEPTVKHNMTANTWLVGLYGEHDLNEQVTLDAHLSFGRSTLKGERQFSQEGLTAKSRTHAWLYQAGVGVTLNRSALLKPFARLDYTRVDVGAFTEHGAQQHDQHVERDTYQELVARLGVEAGSPITSKLSWSARASVGVDMLNAGSSTHASFVDGSGHIAVKNDSPSRMVGDLSLGLAYQVSPNWTLSTSLIGEMRTHQRDGALDLRSTWTF